MFQALKNYIDSSANKVVNKEELVVSAEAMFSAISKNVVPTLKAVSDSEEYFKSDRIVVLGNMAGDIGLRNNSPEEAVKALLTFFKDVLSEEKNFMKLLDTQLGDKLFPALFKAQDVAIIRTISDITSITLYTIDLMYYVMLSDDTAYPKRKVMELKANIPYFVSELRPYRENFGKHVDTLYKVSKNDLPKDAPVALMDKLLSKHGKVVKLPVINGFINNPIYHVRLWMADRDLDKYEALKEKKKLVELKLLDIKLQASGKYDERLAKQIEYYEEKISGLEYKISDIEDID